MKRARDSSAQGAGRRDGEGPAARAGSRRAAVAVGTLVGQPPRRFEDWNPAMRGAYSKGAVAAHAGEAEGACPYEDRRKASGRLTWSRAFISAWTDGYRDAVRFIAAGGASKRVARPAVSATGFEG
jgi:hypothetical protein